MNLKFEGLLIRDLSGKSDERDLTLIEADKLKILLTKMRRVWRAVPESSRNVAVKKLKEILTATVEGWERKRPSMLERCRSTSMDLGVVKSMSSYF